MFSFQEQTREKYHDVEEVGLNSHRFIVDLYLEVIHSNIIIIAKTGHRYRDSNQEPTRPSAHLYNKYATRHIS